MPRRNPSADEVELAVETATVNPIDVRGRLRCAPQRESNKRRNRHPDRKRQLDAAATDKSTKPRLQSCDALHTGSPGTTTRSERGRILNAAGRRIKLASPSVDTLTGKVPGSTDISSVSKAFNSWSVAHPTKSAARSVRHFSDRCAERCTPKVGRNPIESACRSAILRFGIGCYRRTGRASRVRMLPLGPCGHLCEGGNSVAQPIAQQT